MFGLFCYCHFVIRQGHGFGSTSEPHQLPGWLCAQFLFQEHAGLDVRFCVENGTAVLSTERWLWALIHAWWIERQSSLTEESSQRSQVRTRKLEVRSRKLEIRSGKLEVGSGKWEVGRGKSEVGNGKSEVGSRKSEVRTVGSGKWKVRRSSHSALLLNGQKSETQSSHFVKSEVWSLKSEVWSWKSEVGSRKSEVGSWKSEVGSRKSEVGSPSSAFVL